MVTEAAGNTCGMTEAPYINDCDYDAAGELLQHVVGPMKLPAQKASGRIVRFSQEEFAAGHAGSISLAKEGYLYLPKACETGGCRVHVAFHGCRQNAEAVAERFVGEAGYNRWADANRLVVLYPQTANRYFPVFNPRGCWDWWGYTGARYHTKAGPQIRAVKAMVERLAAPRPLR
jgi:poly(3-hydroxybutyrate) depolymerase